MPIKRSRRVPSGLPQDWGSGGDGRWRVLVFGGPEALPEAGAERAVVDGAADPEQPVGAAPGPAHLLRFGHPTVHQEVGRALGQRRADPPPRPVSLGVVDQPVALAGEVAVQRRQGGPKLAPWCRSRNRVAIWVLSSRLRRSSAARSSSSSSAWSRWFAE